MRHRLETGRRVPRVARPVVRGGRRRGAPARAVVPVVVLVAVLSSGLAAGAGGIGTTTAAHHESSFLRADAVTSQFDVGLRLPGDDGVSQVGPAGTELEVAAAPGGEGRFVPGATARLEVEVFNNSETLPAAVRVALGAAGEATTVHEAVRASGIVTYASGEQVVLFGDPADPASSETGLAEAQTQAGVLAPRGQAALLPGEPWLAGADGSVATVTLWLHLPQEAEVEDGNRDMGFVARFDGSSA